MKAIKIKMKRNCGDSRNVQDIDSIYIDAANTYWKKSEVYDYPLKLPYTLRSEIPYQSISPLTAIHIFHFHSYNLIFLLSLHGSPFQISPCLLSTGACHAPVLIIKEELPSKTLRHSSSVQILFSRPFPFFLCRGSFKFSIQVTHDHSVQFFLQSLLDFFLTAPIFNQVKAEQLHK